MGPVIVWGELARILPVTDWLPGCTIAPLDSVAAGTALLCRAVCQRELSELDVPLAGIRCKDGAYFESLPETSRRSETAPLLESLPFEFCRQLDNVPGLRVISPVDKTLTAQLSGKRLRIGRHPDCEWVFDPDIFPQVSAFHAEIVRHGDNYILHDLESTNGTYVNDERITDPVALKSGDIIRLGQDDPRIDFQSP